MPMKNKFIEADSIEMTTNLTTAYCYWSEGFHDVIFSDYELTIAI